MDSGPFSPPTGSRGSPAGAGGGLDAASLEQQQVGGAVAAGHARLVARPDLVPVVAGFGAAGSAGVVHGAVFTLGRWRKGGRVEHDIKKLFGAAKHYAAPV